MTRINTNVPSLIAQRNLRWNNADLDLSLERLSTGLRINRGKDDPAGLIASENLRSEISGLTAAVTNAERADQVVNIAEGGLQEVASLLTQLQSLVTQSANDAGLSAEEREANQLQVDSILQTIDRLSSATSFQGLKLLNGNMDYLTENISAVVSDFAVRGAKLGYNETRDVTVVVTASAQVGGFYLSFGNGRLNLGGDGDDDGRTEQLVVEVVGAEGAREISFASGVTLATMRDTINGFTSVTGVEAVVSGTGLRLVSDELGQEQFVSLRVVDSGNIEASTNTNIGVYDLDATNTGATAGAPTAFDGIGNGLTDRGQDVRATINGVIATTRGTVAQINTDFLDVEVDLAFDTSGPAGPNAAKLGAINAFTITGGGADFQLASRVDISGKVSIGIQNVAVRELGRRLDDFTGGTVAYYLKDIGAGRDLNLETGNLDIAQKVIAQSIKEVSQVRGRLGAFQQNTIGATIRSLGIALENTTAAESIIRDTDFAGETSRLTQAQVLASSATSSLAIANNQPQAVLQLLG